MRDRLIKTLIADVTVKDSDLRSNSIALELADSKLTSEIQNRTIEYSAQGHLYVKTGKLKQALKSFNEAARTYSKIKPVSTTSASCYKNIATIYNLPGDQRDIEQALYFYKKAVKIYACVRKDKAYATQEKDLFTAEFTCYSIIGSIYYEMGAAYDCRIGTPYDYDFCLMSKDTKIEAGKLYLAREKADVVYWVIKNGKIEKGTINSILIPYPFTIDRLNYSKSQILDHTSRAGHTRVYDEIDVLYAKKMKKKGINYNRKILSAYIKKYGISSSFVADCCINLGNQYRSIKQHEIANYFFENADAIKYLKKICDEASPFAYSATHAELMGKIPNTGIDFEAEVLSAFIKEHGKRNFATAKCCSGIGALYHLIGKGDMAAHFFYLASEITALGNPHLIAAKKNKKKADAVQSKLGDLNFYNEKIYIDWEKKQHLLDKYHKKIKMTFIHPEVKLSRPSHFNSNTLFCKNSSATGHLCTDSFTNTSTATFVKATPHTELVTTSGRDIFGFLQKTNQENKLLAIRTNSRRR